MTSTINVPANMLLDMSNNPPVLFRADRLKLSLSDVFTPGKFLARQLRLNVGTVLRVKAVDGTCWAEVTAILAGDILVIEPDMAPALGAAPEASDAPPARSNSRRAA